jgi:hypothetical protein
MTTIIEKEADDKQPILDFQRMLAKLEMEIHARGELTVAEVLALLRLFYIAFSARTIRIDDPAVKNYVVDEMYTRLASLLSLWASCVDETLGLEDLCELALCKEIIVSVFYNSGFRGFSHLKTYLSEKTSDGSFIIPQHKLLIYFTFIHIDDLDQNYLNLALQLNESHFTVLMMAWLNQPMVLTSQGEFNRKVLFDKSAILSKVNPNKTFMATIMNAWMYCSYSPSVNKRVIKTNLNKMIQNYLAANGLVAPKVKYRAVQGKPKILVIHERVGRNHAMFRCYLPFFETLGDYFEVYSLAEGPLDDESLSAVFPKHFVCDPNEDLKGMLAKIADISPDIIYYPSLGMSHWTIYLANMRLASMQFMTCGHPESSFSNTIDFIYTAAVIPGVEHIVSENVLMSSDHRFYAEKHSALEYFTINKTKHNDGKTHIALNCAAMKISSEFVNALKQIRYELGENVQFHFFPAGSGFSNDGYRASLYKIFPDAIVYSPMPYDQFLNKIAACHFSLAPFPFGNTNSTVDAILVGIPVIILKGYELASYWDYMIANTFELSDILVCETVEDYVKKAVTLANDRNMLANYSERVSRVNAGSYFDAEKPEFGAYIMKVYEKLNMYKSKNNRKIIWDKDHIV